VLSADDDPRDAFVDLDSHGRGISGFLPPGKVRLVVSGPREQWYWYPQESWSIPSGETLHIALDAPIVEGTVRLVDAATGMAIARKEVLVGPAGDVAESHLLKTDAEGRITLALVQGRCCIQFCLEDGPTGEGVPSPYEDLTFQWNDAPEAGLRLEVPRKR
jgi:hypothetical protein